MIEESKACSRCFVLKDLSLFFRDKTFKDGRSSCCKECKMKKTYEWREKNRDRYNATIRAYTKKHRRRIHFKRYYGITIEQFNLMIELQNHKCLICGKENRSKKRPFAVDHCHLTGKIRGILCYGCNRAISILDNPDLLKKAKEYLSIT